LRECTPARYRHNIRQIVNLGTYSRAALQALRRDTGIAYDCVTRGILQIYTSEKDFHHALALTEVQRSYGIERHAKTPREAVAIEPALAHYESRLVGALYAPQDESGDAHAFTHNLARLCEQAGVTFAYRTDIKAILGEENRIAGVRKRDAQGEQIVSADAYVVALGSYSPLLLRPLGVSIPVYPAKGYSITLDTQGHAGAPAMSLTDESHKLVFSRLGDRLRVAGTAELCGYDTGLNMVRCAMLMRRTRELFPDAADYDHPQYWAGLRPAMPSNCPVIGRSARYGNLYLNTGHGTLGWTESCGSAHALADIVSGRKPEVEYDFWGLSEK